MKNVLNSVNRDKYVAELTNLDLSDAKEIKLKIINSELQVINSGIMSAVDATGKTVVKMFDSSTLKAIGICNISEGRPEKNALHLLVGIRVVAVTLGAASTPATIKSAAYANIDTIAGAQNGVLSIRSNKRTILDEQITSVFATPANDEKGLYYLNNPKWIMPDQPLEAEFEFGATLPDNTIIKLELLTLKTAR